MKKWTIAILALLLSLTLLFSACGQAPISPIPSIWDDDEETTEREESRNTAEITETESISSTETQKKDPASTESHSHTIDGIPAYSGNPNIAINNNVPSFT